MIQSAVIHKDTYQAERHYPFYTVGSVDLTIGNERRRVQCTHANEGTRNELYDVLTPLYAKSSTKARVEWRAICVFNVDGSVRSILAVQHNQEKYEKSTAILVAFEKGGAR